ncbi:unnamed protein product [Dicrocoelium dendriticum]|nr:unnamed protein product [Dicrocoelium dendriticum]
MSLRCSRVPLVVRSTLSHCFRPQVPVTYRPFLCGALQPKNINKRLRSNVLLGQRAYFSCETTPSSDIAFSLSFSYFGKDAKSFTYHGNRKRS